MSEADAYKYRALVARCNYLSQDRPNIQYATKEACKTMAKPNNEDWIKLKRIGRYLKGEPRTIKKYGMSLRTGTVC